MLPWTTYEAMYDAALNQPEPFWLAAAQRVTWKQPPVKACRMREDGWHDWFPDATLKVYLTASAECRAERRHKQLIEKGESANLPQILHDIVERDARDAARPVAPLRQEPDALLLDTTALAIDQAVDQVLSWFAARQVSGR